VRFDAFSRLVSHIFKLRFDFGIVAKSDTEREPKPKTKNPSVRTETENFRFSDVNPAFM
jgi:hypothetical protein